jgi:hypothetical protein
MIPQLLERRRRNRRHRSGGGVFSPSQVAQVAAGYFWDPAAGSGSGGAGFLIPEGNGKTAYNIITPSAGVAPTITTINGQSVVLYANSAPDKCARVAGNVQRNFTGEMMIWGWVSAPGPNIGFVLHHGRAVVQFGLQLNTADVRVYVHDGTGVIESRFPLPPGGYAAGPFYYEAPFVPSALATNRLQLTIDRVAQVPAIAGSPLATAQDIAEVMGFAAQSSDSSNFNISGDYSAGVMGITNGIPSDADRNLLFNHKRLK